MMGQSSFRREHDAFISYAGKDLQEALWMRRVLELNGISCWMAPEDIPGGSSYADEIPTAIDSCKVFVLVFTDKTNDSVWVPKEMLQALNSGRKVMPFLLEKCTLRNRFAFSLADVQQYPAYEDRYAVTERLLRDIHLHLLRTKKFVIPPPFEAPKPVSAVMPSAAVPAPKPAPAVSVDSADWRGNVLRAVKLPGNGKVYREELAVYDLGFCRREVGTVSFLDSTRTAPKGAVDVSEGENGRVLAWAEKQGEWYDLYIAANGGINGGIACAELFAGMSHLRQVHFNGCFHTDTAESMQFMFAYCGQLQEADLSGFETGCVKSFASMFTGCTALKAVDVTGFDTSRAENLSSMFQLCRSLQTLDITGFDTSKVKQCSSLFQGCSGLRQLDVSRMNTSNVENMYCMFQGCSGLTALDLSSFDCSRVKSMGQMFQGCTNLKKLDAAKLRSDCIEMLQAAFSGCSALEELDLSSWNVSCVTNVRSLFNGCSALRKVDLRGWKLKDTVRQDRMFTACESLRSDGILIDTPLF